MYSLLTAGQLYLTTYPNQKKLALFMPDFYLIRLVKFSSRVMPAFACFALVWQYSFNDAEQVVLVNSVITALFAVSIPFQGLFWLGRRARMPLPLSLIEWYESLRQKLILEQKHLDKAPTIPSYQDFALLLQLAEQTWGDSYFDEL